MPFRNITRSGSALLFFVMLAFLKLNTLTLHLGAYVPHGSTTDYYHFHWDYWWIRHALSEGLPVYRTSMILFPLGSVNLGLHTLTPIWFPVWAGLEPLFGNIAAMNVTIWLGVALTGLWMYILLLDLTHSREAALIGGAFLLMLPYLARSAELNHLNLIAVFHFPMTLWLWRRVALTRKWRWALALGLSFWALWLTDNMWLLFVPLLLAPYGLWTLFEADSWAIRRKLILLGAAAIVLFAALSWGIAPARQVTGFDRSLLSSADRTAAEHWSVDWGLYLLQPGNLERGHSIGRALMILLVVSIFWPNQRAIRGRWLWLLPTAAAMILSIGPDMSIGGTRINLPYWYIHQAFNGQFRTPERFVTPFVVAALIFIGMSWGPSLTRWNRQQRLALVVVALIVITGDLRLHRPIEARPPIQGYAFFEQIAADPQDYVLFEVPVGMSSGWAQVGANPESEYFMLAHHKRIVNGHASRLPDFDHYYYANEIVLGWLAGTQDFREGTAETLQRYVEEWPVGYMAVYQRMMGEDSERAQETIGLLNGMDFLCPVTVERDAIFYRTSAHPAPCPSRRPAPTAEGIWDIDFGVRGDEIFIGQGFHRKEIVGGPTARWTGARDSLAAEVFIDLPPDQTYTMTLNATAFHETRRVTVSVDGVEVGEITILPEGYHEYSIEIPASETQKRRIRFDFGTALSAQDSGDPRTLAFALDWLRIEAHD